MISKHLSTTRRLEAFLSERHASLSFDDTSIAAADVPAIMLVVGPTFDDDGAREEDPVWREVKHDR